MNFKFYQLTFFERVNICYWTIKYYSHNIYVLKNLIVLCNKCTQMDCLILGKLLLNVRKYG